jgi:hypothetical protein
MAKTIVYHRHFITAFEMKAQRNWIFDENLGCSRHGCGNKGQ